jgi:class 3 adenylate cyclase
MFSVLHEAAKATETDPKHTRSGCERLRKATQATAQPARHSTTQSALIPPKTVAMAVSGPQPLAAATSPPTPAEPVGERRHVVVMFCDLVDSTGIAARLDAEEWRDLVGAYVGAASTAVSEMGGKVAKKLGDGLMALFLPALSAGARAVRRYP